MRGLLQDIALLLAVAVSGFLLIFWMAKLGEPQTVWILGLFGVTL